MRRPLLALFLLLVGSHVHAQIVTVNGQVRHRSEYDDKGLTETGDADLFHLLRTRLGVTARPSEHVSAFVQIQDARKFGEEGDLQTVSTLDGSADQLDFHQAYLEVDVPGVKGLSARVGRQELAYGNERLVGSIGWSNIGQAFDGAVLKLDHSRGAADLFAMQLRAPDDVPGSQNLFGLYTSWAIGEDHAVDVFALLDNVTLEITAGPDAGSDVLTRFTPGLRAHGSADAFDYALEGIYQTGNRQTIVGNPLTPISAYLLAAEAGYSTGATRIGAGYTLLSGDDNPADDTIHNFSTLFATNHKFYGFMDYFPRFSTPDGLHDVSLSVTSAISRSLRVRVDGHHFASTAEGATGRSLSFGQEVDLVLSYDGQFGRGSLALNGFQLSGGVSVFFRGGRLEQDLATDPTWWLFLTSQVSF